MKRFLFVLIISVTCSKFLLAQTHDSSKQDSFKNDAIALEKVLKNQVLAWNNGDIYGFMLGYWQSDSLLFLGKKGPFYGWNATYNNYLKNYSNPSTMGKLHFEILSLMPLAPGFATVVGKWDLKRDENPIGGHFHLIFAKKNNNWVIIVDNTH